MLLMLAIVDDHTRSVFVGSVCHHFDSFLSVYNVYGVFDRTNLGHITRRVMQRLYILDLFVVNCIV